MPEYVDTLICDAIRPEANNKATLLGLLGESIFVPAIPTQLASLGIMQMWRPLPGDAPGSSFQFSFELQGPGGQPRIPIPPQPLVVPGGPRGVLNLVVQIQGFLVPAEGDYTITTIIDGHIRNTYAFFIGVPPQPTRQGLIGFSTS